MKLDFLGDAPDHWKGSLRLLLHSSGLKKMYVVPMFTDRSSWNERHCETYARLLKLFKDDGSADTNLIYKGAFSKDIARKDYFDEASTSAGACDVIFLDPNSGIRKEAPSGRRKYNYVLVSDFRQLLIAKGDRLLMIYDESRNHQDEKDAHVDGICEDIREAGFDCCAYESGRNLTMFFVGKNGSKALLGVSSLLKVFLGPCAEGERRSQVQSSNRLFT